MRKFIAIVFLLLFIIQTGFGQKSLIKDITVKNLTDTLIGGVGGIAIDIVSDLYVADFARTVWRINRRGHVETFTNAMYGSSGNAIDAQGNLYQSEFYANTISKIYRNGKIEQIAEGLQGPVAIGISDDTLFVCNYRNNAILKVSKDGKVFDFCKSDLLVGPNGLTIGPRGNIYVVNFKDPNVIKIDRKGNASIFAKLPTSTGGHIVFHNQNFYVTAFKDHKILKVDMAGNAVVFAGSGIQGNKNGSAAQAQFSNPNGIVGFRNSLFVNDKFIDPNGGPTKTIIRQIDFTTLNRLLSSAYNKGGISAASKAYWEYKNHPSYSSDLTELEINRYGYAILNEGKNHFALEIFKLNSESYPDSFNVWDSLAEAYMVIGENENAIKYYEKSLVLNSNNRNARTKLKELKAKLK